MLLDRSNQNKVTQQSHVPRPFDLVPVSADGRPTWRRWLAAPLMHLTGLATLNKLYDETQQLTHRGANGGQFVSNALQVLDITLDVSTDALTRVPRTGPVVLVANHPFGGLDGLVLMELMRRLRPDARIFANFLLHRIPELREQCIFVDPFDGADAALRNSQPVRTALRWLKDGHVLGAFPSGEVAHTSDAAGGLLDSPWNPIIARLIQRSEATVVPIYFAGRNSRWFQLAGRVHPRLRTVLLPRELLRSRGQTIRVSIGHPISHQRLARFEDATSLSDYVRARTFALRANLWPKHTLAHAVAQSPCEISLAQSPATLAQEIESLPPDTLLLEHGSTEVRCASSEQIPQTLHEIARLRELTFRTVGEGTGQAADRDRFDDSYAHLFLWDRDGSGLLGAYRMGRTDRILDAHGADGLYTSTLFRYAPRLLDQLRSGLELGRSFVVPEAQRSFTPLMLLWKGIARYVSLHPQYCGLYGAVSISDTYDSHTRQLLIHFLRLNHFHPGWAADVHPRHPFHAKPLRPELLKELSIVAQDLDDVEAVLDDIESSGRGVPILIRQYLRLEARVLGFNVDPQFGDALDALMYIDLPHSNPRILGRFFGHEAAREYCRYHGVNPIDPQRAAS
jgi:putative hemolysin